MLPQTALEASVAEFCRRPEVAPRTRAFYREGLRVFASWSLQRGISAPAAVTAEVVVEYAEDLEQRQGRTGRALAVATRRAYLKAVQQWLSWLRTQKGSPGVDPASVPMPRLRRRQRDVLSAPEVDRLEDAATGERDKLIVRLMAATGAREGEVASVTLDDLVQREGRYNFVRVRGKTGERLVPIPAGLYRRLVAYGAGKTGRPATRSRFLFMAERRPNGEREYRPLTADGVYQAFKDAAARADLGKRVYPHLLRHTAITAMVASGMNIVTVSEIVGVSVAVIASHYAHQSDEQRHRAMERLWE